MWPSDKKFADPWIKGMFHEDCRSIMVKHFRWRDIEYFWAHPKRCVNCDGAWHSVSRKSSSYKTRSAAQAIKSEPARAGKLLFVPPKLPEPCIMGSRLHQATVTQLRKFSKTICEMMLKELSVCWNKRLNWEVSYESWWKIAHLSSFRSTRPRFAV